MTLNTGSSDSEKPHVPGLGWWAIGFALVSIASVLAAGYEYADIAGDGVDAKQVTAAALTGLGGGIIAGICEGLRRLLRS